MTLTGEQATIATSRGRSTAPTTRTSPRTGASATTTRCSRSLELADGIVTVYDLERLRKRPAADRALEL